MIFKKSGKGPPSFTRDEFYLSAAWRANEAAAVEWLARYSEAVILGEPAPEPDGLDSRAMLRIRVRQEELMNDQGGAELPQAIREVLILNSTLLAWAKRLRDDADHYRAEGSAVRRGRPAIVTVTNALMLHGPNMRLAAPKIAKRRGRPATVDAPDDAILGFLDANAGNGSELDRLKALAGMFLRKAGKHTAGDRLESLARNLQRRVVRARAVRKLKPK